MSTTQQLIDKVYNFHRENGSGWRNADELSHYYINNRNRCSIGALLEPTVARLFELAFQGSILSAFAKLEQGELGTFRQELYNLLPEDMDDSLGKLFLEELQRTHDYYASVGYSGNELAVRIYRQMQSKYSKYIEVKHEI